MNPTIIFLAIVLGVIIFLTILVVNIKNKITSALSKLGFNNIEQMASEIKKGEIEAITTPKHAPGMTKLLIPKIVKDFPNFNEKELFNKVETSLLLIFNSLENKKIENSEELILMKEKLKEKINDMKENNINEKYYDIKFHNHALKYYKKDSSTLNITVSTSLEYFYVKKQNNKIVTDYTKYKKQTLYTIEFIYVYDPNKISKHQNLIGINCPNCGAPVKDLGNKVCRYCNSGLEDINLKSWHIVLYKEEYK